MKILLVEDHPAVARISCDLLRDLHGHEVEHADSGSAALTGASAFAPDIVLIDLNLPDMNGYELAVRLREQPQFQRTVLVVLTGFGDNVDPRQAAAADIDAHFRKPMDFEVLPGLKRADSAT